MSTPGPISQLNQIMDVSNPSISAWNIFSSMGRSDCDDDFQKPELDPRKSWSVYLLQTQKQMPTIFHRVRASDQQ